MGVAVYGSAALSHQKIQIGQGTFQLAQMVLGLAANQAHLRLFQLSRREFGDFSQLLPEGVERMAQRVPIAETNFFSIVIAIQAKSGGNLSEALGNLSRVLRERKKMKGKISAMSMEAKASAAIIGAVPFLVVGALYVSSPKYISMLWVTTHGRMISLIAIFWMGIGIAMMKKMIAFDF